VRKTALFFNNYALCYWWASIHEPDHNRGDHSELHHRQELGSTQLPEELQRHGQRRPSAAHQLSGLDLVAGRLVNDSKALTAPSMKKATAGIFYQRSNAVRVFQWKQQGCP